MYPDGLGGSPYADRFTAAATQRYQALGIDRDDPDRPSKVAALNTNAFGAPVVLFCYLDPAMGPGLRRPLAIAEGEFRGGTRKVPSQGQGLVHGQILAGQLDDDAVTGPVPGDAVGGRQV